MNNVLVTIAPAMEAFTKVYSPARKYAPAKFAQEAEAKKANVRKDALSAAMLRLFERNVIWNLAYGKPSRSSFRIAIKQGD